jgi:hypothetical protein
VRCWAVGVLGIWKGEGLSEGWDKGGQFTSNLRPRWTIPVTARSVPDSKSRNIPEVVFERRWAVGVLGIWREGVGWVKGGANGVSLSASWD